MQDLRKTFIILLLAWLFVTTTAVTILTADNKVTHAVVMMAMGLIILWVYIGGSVMYIFRDQIRNYVLAIPLQWQIKFVCFATLLALLEEVITTSMTNLAPLFGVKIGEAYITASTNFFDVVFYHSVITFIGPFVFWAMAIKRYDFSPFMTFLIWGLSGLLAEVSFGGLSHFAEFAQWIFVYGLMIFLPAYSIPSKEERGAKPVQWYHAILAIFLPLLFVPFFTWIPKVIDPTHPPAAHF